jgi:hypothetical protein
MTEYIVNAVVLAIPALLTFAALTAHVDPRPSTTARKVNFGE